VLVIIEIVLAVILSLIAGVGGGYLLRKRSAEAQIGSAEDEAKRIVAEAEAKGESRKKEALLEAKEDIHRLRQELDRDTKDRRSELQRQERRIVQKEENLDRKLDSLEKKEEVLLSKEAKIDRTRASINELRDKQKEELERISSLTAEEARTMLLTEAEEELKHEKALMIKDYEQQTKDEADKRARDIVSLAIQRCAADQVAEAVRNLNASTYLPKVVSTPTEQGTITVHMQHTFNWVAGASDAQLNAEVSQFLMATIAMMNQLDIAFPDQWAKEADHA